MKISHCGIWKNAAVSDYVFDVGLASSLVEFFKEQGGSVLDIGCGAGNFTRAFKDADIECDGYDGAPNVVEMSNGLCGVMDFSVPVFLPSFDWVLCLEVGEHIPAEFEHDFIENLHRLNIRGVVLSWAVPGQGGVGHVNERSNDYIRNIFDRLGYWDCLDFEQQLRNSVTISFWFRNTLMVFEKNHGYRAE